MADALVVPVRHRIRRRARPITWLLVAATAALVGLTAASGAPRAAAQAPATVRDVDVKAVRYEFTPSRIEVKENDLVTVHFTAGDIAHSFTIDAYRIAKRAAAGQTVTFSFRADRAGTFPFYCNLVIDDGCKKMRGELVVEK